jgi:streptogramin lyase
MARSSAQEELQRLTPWAIAVDRLGRICIADGGNNRLVRINDMTGAGWISFGTEGGGRNQFRRPASIFLDQRSRIYLADWGNGRIVRIDDMTGAGWTALGPTEVGAGHFAAARSIFVDTKGRIYVAGPGQVVRMDDISGAGWTTLDVREDFYGPLGIAVDATGRIYMSGYSGALARVDGMTGAGWTTLGTDGHGWRHFNSPFALALDTTGRIYVADQGNFRIVRVNDIGGDGWITLGHEGSFVARMVTGPDQCVRMWFLPSDGHWRGPDGPDLRDRLGQSPPGALKRHVGQRVDDVPVPLMTKIRETLPG